jgi:nucleotide-binding universal stress UspA family protein
MTTVGRAGADDEAATPRIVVGVDGHPGSLLALDWAAHEAAIRCAVLEVVHVDLFRHEAMELFAPDVLRHETSVLDQAITRARTAEPSIVVRGRLCEPPAAEALIDASVGADLLVLGSQGLNVWKEVVAGSVSHQCAQHASCPVVIIPPTRRDDCREPCVGVARPTVSGGGPDSCRDPRARTA